MKSLFILLIVFASCKTIEPVELTGVALQYVRHDHKNRIDHNGNYRELDYYIYKDCYGTEFRLPNYQGLYTFIYTTK